MSELTQQQEDIKTERLYTTYHPTQAKAIKKYHSNNKDKINEKLRQNYKEKMSDPIQREEYNKKSKQYYHLRKQRRQKEEEAEKEKTKDLLNTVIKSILNYNITQL